MKLKDLCDISAGGTPSRTNDNYWNNGTIPWLKISDLKSKYINSCEEYITEEALKNSSAKLFSKGTLLYTIFATIGEVAILEIDASTNQAIAGLKIKDSIIQTEYLYYYLKSLKNKMIKESRGVAQNNINLSILRELEIDIPSIEKQKNVIATLSKLEELINTKTMQIKNCDQIIKSQFVEMFKDEEKYPKEYLKDNVLEMFIGPFGSALKNECFVDENDSSCVVYEQKHAINKYIDEFRYVDKNKHNELKRFEILPKDIIVSCRGTIGETFVIPEDAPLGIMHPSIMKIRLNLEKYNPVFFNEVIKQYLSDNINMTKGGTIKMGIKATDLGNTKFIRPKLEEQIKFLNIKNQIDKQKFVATKIARLLGKIAILC